MGGIGVGRLHPGGAALADDRPAAPGDTLAGQLGQADFVPGIVLGPETFCLILHLSDGHLELFRGALFELGQHILTGLMRRGAHRIGNPAAAAQVGKGGAVGITHCDGDVLGVKLEFIGHHLGNRGAGAGQVHGADKDGSGGVRVDFDLGTRCEGAPDPIAQSQTPAAVGTLQRRGPARMRLNLFQHLGQADTVERHAQGQCIAFFGGVFLPKRQRVDAGLVRQGVHQGFNRKGRRRATRGAVGLNAGLVGQYVKPFGDHIVQLIWS